MVICAIAQKRREKLSTLKSVQSSGAKESLEARIKQVDLAH